MYDSDENVAALEINSMNRSSDTNIIWVSPNVDGTPLRMYLDTDSAISVINNEISPLGIVDVDVEYNGQQQTLPLFVVKYGGPALFGPKWRSKIKLDKKIYKIPCCNTAQREIAVTIRGNDVGV